MALPESTTPLYATGFGKEVTQMLRRYNAEDNAAYLLPLLRPGLRLLDFGCGLDSASVGLAKAVEPGEMHGVDAAASQVEWVRSVAEARGQSNAVFHVADLAALPFDVVNCHNVLMYIPDTRAVLAEVNRVLKPGGVIGCREMILDSSFIYPDLGATEKLLEVLANLVALDNGHPQMGKDLKSHVLAAGFENVRAAASSNTYSAPADVAFIHSLITQWLLSPEIAEMGVDYGVPSPETWGRMRAAADEWKESPEAIAAFAYGEVIANKP